jgi:Holliday junction resolvasome RuvABC DNA-binding subunit
MMTNNQAQAYTAMALDRLGYDKEEIKKVMSAMYSLFDFVSEEEAEEAAKKIPGSGF